VGAQPVATSPAGVLLVGAVTQDRAWVESTLLRGGLAVRTATEADTLVERKLAPPKLVVIDDSGTRPERMATLRRLQAHPALKGVPILMLAYDSDIDSFTDAITKGTSAYLVKPVGPDELVIVARRLSGWVGTIDHTERRRRSRRPLIVKVEVHLRARETRVMGQILDVSGTGCRVEIPAEVQKGELLRLVLQGQDDSTHVALGVDVRWCRPSKGVFLAGCRFTGTTALLAGKLLGFVSMGAT
jgi:two-component system, chemotaxis family, chemotaxis protein CheY